MSSDDSWKMLTTNFDDGKVVIYRLRERPPSYARREDFPYLLAVQWEYESPNEHGLPFDDIATHMLEFENLLTPAFENGRQAFPYVVVTGNGVREWQWYVRDRKRIMELVNETLGELEPFPIKFVFRVDPEWKTYTRFLADSGREV